MSDMQQRIKEQAYTAAYQDDAIDLFELWNGLVEEKKTIFVSFFAVLILAGGYIFITKPQYEASAILQVQQVQLPIKDSSGNMDSPYVSVEPAEKTVQLLSGVVTAEMSSGKGNGRDNGYIEISSTGADKQQIQKNVKEAVKTIEERYQEIFSKLKPLGYAEILPTKVIGGVKLSNKPVKPKKTLILAVAGVLGLMIGVMVALVRRAYRNRQTQMEAQVS
jgi:uncharacterized protein involved in exopolysaccharide biosynthesis